jgi:methyl-accepting chemotaxis protein
MVLVSSVMLGLSYFETRKLFESALASCAEVGMNETQISTLVIGFALFFMIASFFLGIYFSHRTAGPMYRFSKVFESAGMGNYKERIKLRPNDDFQDVAELFNKLMDRVQKDLASRAGLPPAGAPHKPPQEPGKSPTTAESEENEIKLEPKRS